jgi:hypothetical protein
MGVFSVTYGIDYNLCGGEIQSIQDLILGESALFIARRGRP